MKYQSFISFVRDIYNEPEKFIPLHEPRFVGNEKKYLNDCIDSTFVSSVGQYVDKFEEMMCEITGAKHAIAIVNGTCALHLALEIAGVDNKSIVVTQSLSFAATANAIMYTGAEPYFIDVDKSSLGMSAKALENFLKNVKLVNGTPVHQPTNKRVGAIVPMHTFGFPCEIDKIAELANQYNIPVVEDAAESLGSYYKGKHTGTFGLLGTYSFNGNKTVTCGGGGIIVTNDSELARRAKHLSTQAKVPHRWEYKHDAMGYNYRCPNINAALACAQLEQLDNFIDNKRNTAEIYANKLPSLGINHIGEPTDSRSNFWLNAVMLNSQEEKLQFLEETNDAGVMTRPVWGLLHQLPHLLHCGHDSLENSIFIEQRLVNIPSSVRV